MKTIFKPPFISLYLLFSVSAGYIARFLEKSFWLWFLLSIPVPLFGCILVAWLPAKNDELKPVESQDIFKELNGIR